MWCFLIIRIKRPSGDSLVEMLVEAVSGAHMNGSPLLDETMRVQVRRANGGFHPLDILDRMKRLTNRIGAGGEIE